MIPKQIQDRLLAELAHFRESVMLYKVDEVSASEILKRVDEIAVIIEPHIFDKEIRKP